MPGFLVAHNTFPYTDEDRAYFADILTRQRTAMLDLILCNADTLRSYIRLGLLTQDCYELFLAAAIERGRPELNIQLLQWYHSKHCA